MDDVLIPLQNWSRLLNFIERHNFICFFKTFMMRRRQLQNPNMVYEFSSSFKFGRLLSICAHSTARLPFCATVRYLSRSQKWEYRLQTSREFEMNPKCSKSTPRTHPRAYARKSCGHFWGAYKRFDREYNSLWFEMFYASYN